MEFSLDQAIPVLRSTPHVLRSWLADLPDPWITTNEGEGTWSPYDIVGHLIHGERTDWIPRIELILKYGQSRAFTPFDRFAQFTESRGKTLNQLLDTFAELRELNLGRLSRADLSSQDLVRGGLHPELGPVALGHLLATWVVHDLNHLAQIARVMSRRYRSAVGPWIEYLPILTR
jgi:DinB family protein